MVLILSKKKTIKKTMKIIEIHCFPMKKTIKITLLKYFFSNYIIIMKPYFCSICMFTTKLKGNYKQHLNTKKHDNNLKKYDEKNHIMVMTQNDPKMTRKNLARKFSCDFCNSKFTTHAHKRRHELHRCKENKVKEIQTIKLLKEEKKILYNQIDKLIDKAGNTTINNQLNNISLNNYGKEDLSHITDSFKSDLLKIPFGMIPKMIEAVHFNPVKPENNNIALPNKKEKTIKIFSGNKWIYKDKEDVINDLLDGKYFIMDTFYDKVAHNMNSFHTHNYQKFKTDFDDCDKELLEKLKKQCELILLNNR